MEKHCGENEFLKKDKNDIILLWHMSTVVSNENVKISQGPHGQKCP